MSLNRWNVPVHELLPRAIGCTLSVAALLFVARLIPSWRVILIVCALVEAVLAGRYWILYFKKKQS